MARKDIVKRTRSHMRPQYWWDFNHYPNGDMTIVIETTDPRIPRGVIRETDALPTGYCDHIIDEIRREIADYEAGRRRADGPTSTALAKESGHE